MSKRIIFNDSELATHEDVQNAQDWVSRDLGRVLEGISLGTLDNAPASGTNGVAIVSGLRVTGSPSNLSLTVSAGSALFTFAGVDPASSSSYLLGELEADYSTTLTIATIPAGYERWFLVEVSASKVVVNDNREVLSPTGSTTTSVPKLEEATLTVRVRNGVKDLLGSGTIPTLQPDPGWLPIAAFRVVSGDLSLSSATFLDLRKLLSHFTPVASPLDPNGGDGFSGPVSFHVSPDHSLVYVSRLSATMGEYSSPLSTSPSTFSPLLLSQGFPHLTLADESPDSVATDGWKYIYAYRPSPACGYTTLCLSSVPPVSLLITYDGLHPTAPITPPAPFNTDDKVSSLALCLGAVLPYTDSVSGDKRFRLSTKSGGFTRQTYATTNSSITGGEVITPSTALSYTDPSYTGVVFNPTSIVVSPFSHPASAVGIRLLIRIRANSSGSNHDFWVADTTSASSVESSALFATVLFPGEIAEFTLDVPSSIPAAASLTVFTTAPGTEPATIDVRAVGFYEAY